MTYAQMHLVQQKAGKMFLTIAVRKIKELITGGDVSVKFLTTIGK